MWAEGLCSPLCEPLDLNDFATWQLAPPRGSDPGGSEVEATVSLLQNLGGDIPSLLLYPIGHTECGRGLLMHEHQEAAIPGAILEAAHQAP